MLASVADTYGPAGVGVMLSGMGRDGLVGSRRLVERGGAMLAQDRAQRRDLGHAPGRRRSGPRLAPCCRRPSLPARIAERAVMEVSDSSRRILASLLEARTGQQLAMNRRWRIDTALAAIMRERGFDIVDQLVARLVVARAIRR